LTGYAEYAVRSVVYTRVHSSRFTPPFRLQPADIQTLIIVTPERRFESRTVYSVVKDPGSCRHVYLNAVGVFFKGCPTNCLIPRPFIVPPVETPPVCRFQKYQPVAREIATVRIQDPMFLASYFWIYVKTYRLTKPLAACARWRAVVSRAPTPKQLMPRFF